LDLAVDPNLVAKLSTVFSAARNRVSSIMDLTKAEAIQNKLNTRMAQPQIK